MRSSEERIAQLHRVAGRMARERAQRRAVAAGAGMAAVCLALAVALALTVSRTALRMPSGVLESRMASIFVENGAVGYIFVAVLAFALGALFTVFCVRLRRLKAEKERDDDRKL